MSMISEALKKAETGSTHMAPPSPPRRPLWLYRSTLIAAVGIVLTGVAVITHRPPVSARTAVPAAAPIPAQPAKNKGLELFRAAQGGMGLSGIIRGGHGESLALIDNQIVKEGDQLHGMRVVQVNTDSVQVEDQSGKAKTLKLD